ncbi:MAG: ATP-binding protein [Bacilli bacterium]
MERKINDFLKKWKRDISRKPLLIYGNKQVGKTYSVLEFGRENYKNIVYFNSENYLELIKIFKTETTSDKIIFKLSLLSGEKIMKNDTLLVIDNVNNNDIVKGIKLFSRENPNYHIIMITSLKANLARFKGEELQFKQMFPMDFEEYLMATDNKQLIEFIKESYNTDKPMPFHTLAMDLYNEYLMIGGMPEVVKASIDGEDEIIIKSIQSKIRDTYFKDFCRMKNLIDIPRNIEVMYSVPYQLLKDNKKFQYGLIGQGKRSKEYESSIAYLSVNNLFYKVHRISEAKLPLSSCKDKDSFKLYYNDNGLLFNSLNISKIRFLTTQKLKDLLYENAIAITLSQNSNPYYYQSEGKAELSFVIQSRTGSIIPIELVNRNLSKSKSLGLFMKKYGTLEAIRVTEDNFSKKKNIKYIPVYATFCLN